MVVIGKKTLIFSFFAVFCIVFLIGGVLFASNSVFNENKIPVVIVDAGHGGY